MSEQNGETSATKKKQLAIDQSTKNLKMLNELIADAGDGKKTVLRNSQMQSDENPSYLELLSNESGETKKPNNGNLPTQDVQKQTGSSLVNTSHLTES